jgi:AcrR family transcriptional regulator
MSRVGPGRRAGSPDTRGEILDAAREVFAGAGYERATMRTIADRAGVDPSLIHHYFESKENLFAASIHIELPVLATLGSVFEGDHEAIGRRLAETFFGVWEQDEARDSLLGVLRSAMSGDDRAAASFREFLTSVMLEQLAPVIRGANPRLRALLMASQLVGLAITRYVMRLEPVTSAPIDEIVELAAPRIQSYVDG